MTFLPINLVEPKQMTFEVVGYVFIKTVPYCNWNYENVLLLDMLNHNFHVSLKVIDI